MNFNKVSLALLTLFFSSHWALAQSKLSATDEARVGIQLIDDGEFEDGIKHLRKARNISPNEYEYPLEIGRAFLLWENPKKAEKYFYPLMEHPNVTPELFTLLSECYRLLPNKEKQEQNALHHGLAKYPNSGLIYCSLGQLRVRKGDTPEALAYWEKGIEVDPEFPDNYLFASKFFQRERNNLWVWLYGETYLNLTMASAPNIDAMKTTRKALMALLNMKKQSVPKADLDKTIFETLTPCALQFSKEETIAIMADKLSCFIQEWSKLKDQPTVPLFQLIAKVDKMGGLTEYLFWLYGEVNRDEMNAWAKANSNTQRFNAFSTWVHWNGLQLDSQKPFNRVKH